MPRLGKKKSGVGRRDPRMMISQPFRTSGPNIKGLSLSCSWQIKSEQNQVANLEACWFQIQLQVFFRKRANIKHHTEPLMMT